jgi:D-xylose transport system ATP-binding protein
MDQRVPLVEMRDMNKSFGGLHAVADCSIDLYGGEVVGVVGHNGAGKSVFMKMLSGALVRDSGEIYINGELADINSPRDAQHYGIETVYQTLALADNLNAPANMFLGREIMTRARTLDDDAMEAKSREVIQRLNPNFTNIKDPVRNMSGGQRQSVAIARAIYFNARILIMDEPTAALGPYETQMVTELIKKLCSEGIGIFLISHDLNDVFDLSDRIMVMKNGRNVGMVRVPQVTQDDVLSLIILGHLPEGWTPRDKETGAVG